MNEMTDFRAATQRSGAEEKKTHHYLKFIKMQLIYIEISVTITEISI